MKVHCTTVLQFKWNIFAQMKSATMILQKCTFSALTLSQQHLNREWKSFSFGLKTTKNPIESYSPTPPAPTTTSLYSIFKCDASVLFVYLFKPLKFLLICAVYYRLITRLIEPCTALMLVPLSVVCMCVRLYFCLALTSLLFCLLYFSCCVFFCFCLNISH